MGTSIIPVSSPFCETRPSPKGTGFPSLSTSALSFKIKYSIKGSVPSAIVPLCCNRIPSLVLRVTSSTNWCPNSLENLIGSE